MPHKFKIGQAVEYRGSRYAPGGTYMDGEFEYHIRNLNQLLLQMRRLRCRLVGRLLKVGDLPTREVLVAT